MNIRTKDDRETPYSKLPNDKLAREIERQSADGAPAHPEFGPGRLIGLLVIAMLTIIGAAIAAGVMVDATLGLLIGIGGVLFFIATPALWATLDRANDRRLAQEHLSERRSR